MLGDGARGGDGAPKPLVANQMERGDETDSGRLHAGLGGDALHLQSYEVVGEEDAPQFLANRHGAFAADGLFAVEHLGLDLGVPALAGGGENKILC